MSAWRATIAGVCILSACASPRQAENAPAELSVSAITNLIPRPAPERARWAAAVAGALEEIGRPRSRPHVCAVLAIIEQESGFQADPRVPGISRMARRALDRELDRLGILSTAVKDDLLSRRAPGTTRSFRERLARLGTERDLDRLFRDILDAYQRDHPVAYAAADFVGALVTRRRLSELNPVTTAGPMQVSVRFALERAKRRAPTLDEAAVRESLYTIEDGVRYGTERLLAYEAAYDDLLFRFADYNAGVYSSRNAAVQQMIATLSGAQLALDGDLLKYEADDRPSRDASATLEAALSALPALGVSEPRLRADFALEKSHRFEKTRSYAAVVAAYAAKSGRRAPLAIIPKVSLESPKLSRPRSTEWFARNVERRFQRCLGYGRRRSP